MNRLSGAWFKLADEGGVHIGLLMVPDGLAEQFEKRHQREVVCCRHPKLSIRGWKPGDHTMLEIMPSLARFLVMRSHHIDSLGMLALFGITPDAIALEPGFAFIPNGEWLRRPVAEKVVEAEPVAPGRHLAAAREVAG